MSESADSKQRSEVDETRREQDEDQIRSEGGPRLNGRLAATAVGIVVGLVVLLTLAVQSSGPRQSTQSGEAGHDADNTTADKSTVRDLIANASELKPAPLFTPPPMEAKAMVICYVTEGEHACVSAQAARRRLSLSRYMKECLLGEEQQPRPQVDNENGQVAALEALFRESEHQRAPLRDGEAGRAQRQVCDS